ncbi:MAG: hypothetical protein WCT23_02380 [Candidatus Neomarinimicrobiota bacterium]|jgi:hypothetical protein
MEFKKRLKLVLEILEDSPYTTQKKRIHELFDKTNNSDFNDIMLRLYVIDSCYSTQMNKRLFSFDDLSRLIENEIEPRFINRKSDTSFIEENFNKRILLHPIGIDKEGNDKGHTFSLISKYLYFRSNFNFPIYDSLVRKELRREGFKINGQYPSVAYFKCIFELCEKFEIDYDDLDKYFWVCGKVRNGSLSLIIKDKKLMERYRNRESKLGTPKQLIWIYELEESLERYDKVLN